MVFITAEIGINHNGSISIAKKLINVAKEAGCDAVKFQKRTVESVYTKDVLDSTRESPWGNTTRDQKKGLEFSLNDFKKINVYCKKKKIQWYVSCWDIKSQIEMRQFKTKYNKVASAMLVHKKLLEIIAKERKYTFISTGMSTMKDISNAAKIFKKHKCPFELMHCHSAYPMPTEEANLNMIPTLKKKFKCKVGYSGHEIGATNISVPAVMMGASSIERHITLSRASYGHDQAASLEPQGIHRLVRDIRILERILGNGKKKIWPTEIPNQKKLRQIFC